MRLKCKSLLADTPEALRSVALLLYAIAGPPSVAALLAAGGSDVAPHAAVCALLLAIGAAVIGLRRDLGDAEWILPGALVPTVSCMIAADALWPWGAVFLAASGAPAAWTAVLFGPLTAGTAVLVNSIGGGVVLARHSDVPMGVMGGALLLLAHGLAMAVVRGKAEALRRAHLALDRAASRQRALLASLPDTVALLDRDGRVLWASAGTEPLPLPADRLIGHTVMEFVPPHVAEEMRVTLARTFAEPGLQRIEYALRCPDGERVFEARAMQVSDGEALVVRRNLTRLREIDARLHQAESLASLGTLAAGVAHEINNPLAYVSSNIEFALDRLRELRPGDPPDAALDDTITSLAEAHDGALRIRDIVRGLQTFARTGGAVGGGADLDEVVQASVTMLRNQVETRGRLSLSLGGVPHVAGDRTRLGQIAVNLIANAGKALPAERPDQIERNLVAVRTFLRDGMAVLEVRDNGEGIAPENLRRIFDPFFTTRQVGEGTGLGLSIALGIARSLGGDIEVESRPHEGSVFRAVLPLAHAHGEAAAPASVAPATSGAPRTTSILIVDDEELVARAIVRVLGARYRVEVAKSGADALARIAAGERYDLILCDLIMPGIGGIDVHERLRATTPEQAERMAFMTGDAFTERARAFLTTAPNRWFTKPISPAALRGFVEGCLTGQEARRDAQEAVRA